MYAGRRSTAGDRIVSKNDAALHDKFDPLHLGDVGQGVAGNSAQVGEFPFFHKADLVRQFKVQPLGGIAGSHAQRVGGLHSPLHVIGELKSLYTVPARVCAAAENLFDPGGVQSFETQLGETDASSLTAAGL